MGVTPMPTSALAIALGKAFDDGSPQVLHSVHVAGLRPTFAANALTAPGSFRPSNCETPRAIEDRPAAMGVDAIARTANMSTTAATRTVVDMARSLDGSGGLGPSPGRSFIRIVASGTD